MVVHQPKTVRMWQALKYRGGPAFVRDFLANGGTMTELAAELGLSRSYVSRHLNADPTYAEALLAGKREGAEAFADETLEIADALSEKRIRMEDIQDAVDLAFAEFEANDEAPTAARMYELMAATIQPRRVANEEVQAAKVRIDTRKWVASIQDPEKYAKKDAAQVNISIGTLHLDALRRRQVSPIEGKAMKVIGTDG